MEYKYVQYRRSTSWRCEENFLFFSLRNNFIQSRFFAFKYLKILSDLTDKILNIKISLRITYLSFWYACVIKVSSWVEKRTILFCTARAKQTWRDCHPFVNKFVQGEERRQGETLCYVNFSDTITPNPPRYRFRASSVRRCREQINKTCLIAPSHPPVWATISP